MNRLIVLKPERKMASDQEAYLRFIQNLCKIHVDVIIETKRASDDRIERVLVRVQAGNGDSRRIDDIVAEAFASSGLGGFIRHTGIIADGGSREYCYSSPT